MCVSECEGTRAMTSWHDTARGGYALLGTCKGHSSFITHLGWSKDASTLFTNSGDYELLFWNAPKGDQIKSGSDCKDVAWDGWTGTLGFEMTAGGGPIIQRVRLVCLSGLPISHYVTATHQPPAVHSSVSSLALGWCESSLFDP